MAKQKKVPHMGGTKMAKNEMYIFVLGRERPWEKLSSLLTKIILEMRCRFSSWMWF